MLREEPGAAAVEAAIDGAAVSTVNLSEVQAKLVERGTPPRSPGPGSSTSTSTWSISMRRRPRSRATFGALTRAHGLSLGDRACLALAQVRGLPVMTADRAWAGLEIGIEIRAVR